MSLPNVAYTDYQAWGGKLGADAFAASLPAAKAAVRLIIGFNVPEGEAQTAAYKNAVCAAVDVDHAYGATGGIGENSPSFTIGSFSYGGGSSSDGRSAYDSDMEGAIYGELSGSGLLYQGVL